MERCVLASCVLPNAEQVTSLAVGNSTYAAISAVVAANVVLVTYIITSVMDDTSANETRSPLADAPGETRKDR